MSKTKLSLLIPKSFEGIKESVISVSLKTPLKNKMGNLCLQNFTSAPARRLYWLYIKLFPHILKQNCSHDPARYPTSKPDSYHLCSVGTNEGKKILWGNTSLFPYVSFSLLVGLPNKLTVYALQLTFFTPYSS